MRWLSKGIALIALVLFGLASEHCRLEAMPEFSFLRCCCGEEEPAPAGPDDCRDTVCFSVESGNYRFEDQPIVCPEPVFVLVLNLADASVVPKAVIGSSPEKGVAPPELRSCWQFLSRAAPLPRAPSVC